MAFNTEPIAKIQEVEIVNTKHFRYLSVWISYNKLRIREKEIENKIGCARGSYA